MYGSNLLASFTRFQFKGTVALFECKLLKFKFKAIFDLNNA